MGRGRATAPFRVRSDFRLFLQPHGARRRCYAQSRPRKRAAIREENMSIIKHARAFVGSIALAGLLAAAPAAYAKTVKLAAKLDASQEVPANDSKGKGTAEVTYDTNSKKMTWTVEYSGMSGPVTGAHFHGPAKPGENADVAVGIAGDLASPIKGSDTLTVAQAKDLQAGEYYLNLHTAAHADGEIRGWVKKAK